MNEKTFRENKKLRNLAWNLCKDGQDWKERYKELSQQFCLAENRAVLLRVL